MGISMRRLLSSQYGPKRDVLMRPRELKKSGRDEHDGRNGRSSYWSLL